MNAKPVYFVLKGAYPSYRIIGPSKRVYQLKGGEKFSVIDLRDITYFDGREDICYRDGHQPHEATKQQKSYIRMKPSIKQLLLQRHLEEKAKRDIEAEKNAAPADVKKPQRTEPRKPEIKEEAKPAVKEEKSKKETAITTDSVPGSALKSGEKKKSKKK